MYNLIRRLKFTGGERGIRTLAALTNTNGLANRPLKPLEYLSIIYKNFVYITIEYNICMYYILQTNYFDVQKRFMTFLKKNQFLQLNVSSCYELAFFHT